MTARQVIDIRIDNLSARGFDTFVPPLQALALELGDVVLSADSLRFLVWVLEFDQTEIAGLAALLRDRDQQGFQRAVRS